MVAPALINPYGCETYLYKTYTLAFVPTLNPDHRAQPTLATSRPGESVQNEGSMGSLEGFLKVSAYRLKRGGGVLFSHPGSEAQRLRFGFRQSGSH